MMMQMMMQNQQQYQQQQLQYQQQQLQFQQQQANIQNMIMMKLLDKNGRQTKRFMTINFIIKAPK